MLTAAIVALVLVGFVACYFFGQFFDQGERTKAVLVQYHALVCAAAATNQMLAVQKLLDIHKTDEEGDLVDDFPSKELLEDLFYGTNWTTFKCRALDVLFRAFKDDYAFANEKDRYKGFIWFLETATRIEVTSKNFITDLLNSNPESRQRLAETFHDDMSYIEREIPDEKGSGADVGEDANQANLRQNKGIIVR